MTTPELLTMADVELMQGLAQRVTALRPDLISADASYGELAWNWGKGYKSAGESWVRELWYSDGELVAWAWAVMPRQVTLSDGSVKDITDAYLAYQVHPDHAAIVDKVIAWFEGIASDLDRTVLPCANDVFGVERWQAVGYELDQEALGHNGDWTQLNQCDLTDLEEPALAEGFQFRTAEEVSPEAAVQAHVDAWAPSTYSLEAYNGVRETAAYRPDLHVLVEAPDGVMAASAIMWFDEMNRTAEFEPVGAHPEYRRRGLARALLLHGKKLAKAAGAVHMTVACEGAEVNSGPRELYYSVGFQELSRDAPLVKDGSAS